MILEDDQDLALRLADYLKESLQIDVITFFNSKNAINALNNREYNFCAFVLDIELVGQRDTGIDVAQEIRNNDQNKNVPIFFLTSYKHFGYGTLRHLHYFDFFTKDTKLEKIALSIKKAIFPQNFKVSKESIIHIKGIFCIHEIDPNNVMCIEQFGREIVITDCLGFETSYRVKPCAFSDLCNQINSSDFQNLQQIHRSIIINLHRIKKIDWKKNTASITLFNSSTLKPVGKTYLEKLKIFKE